MICSKSILSEKFIGPDGHRVSSKYNGRCACRAAQDGFTGAQPRERLQTISQCECLLINSAHQSFWVVDGELQRIRVRNSATYHGDGLRGADGAER